MAKIVPQKNSVEEKYLAKLYARSLALEYWPKIFPNDDVRKLFDKYEYKLPMDADKIAKTEAARVAIAEYNVVRQAKKYINVYPNCCVVNLGCGFTSIFDLIDNGKIKAYNVDTREVLVARKEAVGKDEREKGIIADLLEDDFSWFDQIDWNQREGIFFYAIDVFHYMKREDVKRLVGNIGNKFVDGAIVFDACSAEGVKKVLKGKLPDAEVKENSGFYFSIDDDTQLTKWSINIHNVWRRPYLYLIDEAVGVGKLGLLTAPALKSSSSKMENVLVELKIKR